MAGGIKGITIEIGGDTTKLGKAIDDSEKKSRSLQVELRQVEKLLKFDPTNVELLSQKQTLLTQNVAETSKKLDLLKEAEKQVQEQFERGEASEEQVRALQREIIKTEGVLGSMKKELTSTEKALKDVADGTDTAEKSTEEYAEAVEKAKTELEEFKGKASEAFDTLKTGATVAGGAIVATAGYALKLSTDFDKASNTLITKTGASTDEIDSLNTAMENVYANNFGESIEDVAESMATVRTNTKLTGEELEKTTEYALLIRDTFGFEVNESVRAVNAMMTQFGINAEEAYNLIAQGAQNGLNQNDDLMDVINEYSVHFSQLGLTSEEMFTMLSSGAETGTFSVDKLGDAVKEFGIRVKDGSDSSREAFEYLGYDADSLFQIFNEGGQEASEMTRILMDELASMPDGVEKTTAGVALFGTMWEDLGATAIGALSGFSSDLDYTRDALTDINNIKYDDIGSALQGLGRTLETDVVAPLGEELKPVVEDAIEVVKANAPQIKEILATVVKKVGEFVGFIVNNGDAIVSILGAIGAGFVAWKVASMITGVVNAIKAFKVANEGATIAQWAMNTAMNANPIGIIIGAITALVTAFILLWNNCEGFRNFFINLWEQIKVAFQAFIDWISPAIEIIKELFSLLGGKIKEVWDNILVSLQPLIDAITGAFQSAWDLIKTIWDLVSPYFSAIWEYIKAVFVVAKDVLGLYFQNAWEAIKLVWDVVVSYFSTLWENIKLVFSVVKTFFEGMFRTAWEAIKAIWDAVVGYFTAIWETIKGIFSVVKNVLTGNWSDAWEGIKGIVNTWKDYFSGVWDSIKKVFGSVKTWFSDTFKSAWEAVKGVFSNWGSFFSGLWDKIKNTFSNIGTNISNAISGSLKSGLNGVISAIEKIINNGIGLINGAIDLINQIPGVSIGKLGTLNLPRFARGGIVNKATAGIFGEDGAEAIIPLERNTEWLDKVAQRLDRNDPALNNGELLSKLDNIYDRLNRLQIVLDTGTLVGETIDKIDAGLAFKQRLNARGV